MREHHSMHHRTSIKLYTINLTPKHMNVKLHQTVHTTQDTYQTIYYSHRKQKTKKQTIQKSQKQFWMYFWLLSYEQPLSYSIDLSLTQYWHTQTWLMLSRPICESVRSSHLFVNWTTMVTQGGQCDNAIYTWYFAFWSIGSQVDNRDAFPFTHGVLICLFCLFLTTCLFSLRGRSIYVYMLFLIFQSNIAE